MGKRKVRPSEGVRGPSADPPPLVPTGDPGKPATPLQLSSSPPVENFAVHLQVFPSITVLAATEEEAAAKIDAMEEALMAVNDSVLKGDLFEEVWRRHYSEKGGRVLEDEELWQRPEDATGDKS